MRYTCEVGEGGSEHWWTRVGEKGVVGSECTTRGDGCAHMCHGIMRGEASGKAAGYTVKVGESAAICGGEVAAVGGRERARVRTVY